MGRGEGRLRAPWELPGEGTVEAASLCKKRKQPWHPQRVLLPVLWPAERTAGWCFPEQTRALTNPAGIKPMDSLTGVSVTVRNSHLHSGGSLPEDTDQGLSVTKLLCPRCISIWKVYVFRFHYRLLNMFFF